MKMSFDLDGCHTMEITGNVPRIAHDPASVCINVLYTPLPVMQAPPDPQGAVGYIQAPTETRLSVSLKPSHARAIASALLSAATEARAS